jgi:hypothetical protein
MNQTFKRCWHKNHFAKLQKKKIWWNLQKKTLKNVEEYGTSVFQYTDDDQKKYLKKWKMQQV